jgi:hypothetical protein
MEPLIKPLKKKLEVSLLVPPLLNIKPIKDIMDM